MIATIPYIKQKFKEFNNLCFDGKLKPVVIKLSRARNFLGKVSCLRSQRPDGTLYNHDFTMRISNLLDLPENVIEDTILHEMIHYWILSNQIEDSGSHGPIFINKMNEINSRFNRHITIKHHLTSQDHANDTEKRWHHICITRLNDGRQGITIPARSRLFDLWDYMPHFPGIATYKWVATTDPYFNRYPRVQKPTIYLINNEEVVDHLKAARELERVGDVIKLKS